MLSGDFFIFSSRGLFCVEESVIKVFLMLFIWELLNFESSFGKISLESSLISSLANDFESSSTFESLITADLLIFVG